MDMAGINPRVNRQREDSSNLGGFKRKLQERYKNLEKVPTPVEERIKQGQEKTPKKVSNIEKKFFFPTNPPKTKVDFTDGTSKIIPVSQIPVYEEMLKKGIPVFLNEESSKAKTKNNKASGGKVFANSTRKAKYKAG